MNKFFNFLKTTFTYKPNNTYDFDIEESNNIEDNGPTSSEPENLFEKVRK